MNSLKKTTIALLLLTTLPGHGLLSEAKKEILFDIKEQTKKCTVQTVATQGEDKHVTSYRSTCKTLRLLSPSSAQIYIDAEWFIAKITESAESDGGDLDDLFVYNSKGKLVAKRTNIAAYDNIVVAMAGTTELRPR